MEGCVYPDLLLLRPTNTLLRRPLFMLHCYIIIMFLSESPEIFCTRDIILDKIYSLEASHPYCRLGFVYHHIVSVASLLTHRYRPSPYSFCYIVSVDRHMDIDADIAYHHIRSFCQWSYRNCRSSHG